jgi:hypothetical protein
MTIRNWSYALILLSGIQSCKSQDTTVEPVSKLYENCCGSNPVEFREGDAYMYIPNVFTPNADGINDVFAPQVNDGIQGFDAYLIYSAEGDTLIFASSVYDPATASTSGWKGKRQDGSAYAGGFRYELTVFLKSGALYKVEGKACSIVCGKEAAVFKNKTGCYYPVQVNAANQLDKNLPHMESGCFQ